MDWSDWAPTQAAIRADFGYDEASDAAAARDLRPLLPDTNRLRELGVLVRNRPVHVVGCGPSIEQLHPERWSGPVIAADGATSFLRERGVLPDIVVTDLDGRAEDLLWAAANGSRLVVHAHGDNRDAIASLVPRLLPLVYGTFATEPWPGSLPMESLGGFTDGDRAVLLMEALGARSVTLAGFDFDRPPSRYSHHFDPATKMRKLAWAERIIAACVGRGRLPVRRWMP